MSLDSKVAVVTGSSRGIGAACARELGRQGMSVILAARSTEDLEGVADDIRASGGRAHVVSADLRALPDLQRTVDAALKRFGGIDVLVNNAGVFLGEKEIFDVTPSEWDDAHNLLLRAPWFLSTLVYHSMKARGGGSIVNISSVSGLRHNIGEILYTMPKSGLLMLTKICAKEWARDNIRVNCVAPGWVRTDMSAGMLDQMASTDRPNMLDIILEPTEVAKLVTYLVSDDARAVTGETIRIDAGAFGIF
jgi:dehydrogenase/reductase SDR family protein 4